MNKLDRKEYLKRWRKKHLSYFRNKQKEWRLKHPGYYKEVYKRWQIKNGSKYRRNKILNDPKFHLDSNFSSLISSCLRGKKKWRKWRNLVGYTIEDLMEHLERQFDDKMTWDNYGNYWWLDHIKPRSLFKYERPEDEEFKECWALKNLQPLERIANIKKSNKYNKNK